MEYIKGQERVILCGKEKKKNDEKDIQSVEVLKCDKLPAYC